MRSLELNPAIGFPWYVVDEIASEPLPSGPTARRRGVMLKLNRGKSTASGGETPKGSAVPGVYPISRGLSDTRTTCQGRWVRGCFVSTARLVDHQVSRHLDQQGNLQGALDQTK